MLSIGPTEVYGIGKPMEALIENGYPRPDPAPTSCSESGEATLQQAAIMGESGQSHPYTSLDTTSPVFLSFRMRLVTPLGSTSSLMR